MQAKAVLTSDHIYNLCSNNMELFKNYKLTRIDVNKLQDALNDDARGYFYNGVISLDASLNALASNHYSWSIVSLYYAAFYMIRARLAANGYCIYYVKKSKANGKVSRVPFRLTASIDSQPYQEKDPSTHKLARSIYTNKFIHSPEVTQQIDHSDALLWLMEQRERVNYTICKMPEPNPPELLKKIVSGDLNTFVTRYGNDVSGTYTFDKDHAILALPISLVRYVYNDVNVKQLIAGPLMDEIKKYYNEKPLLIAALSVLS